MLVLDAATHVLPMQSFPYIDRQPAGGVQLLTTEQQTMLHEAIAGLPENYRLLIHLRHLQEMSYAEIAEVTNMPLGSVKTGIFRARKMLKERLQIKEPTYDE